MKATKDHGRVSAEGINIGSSLARMADAGAASLAADDEPDTRCKTCAYRKGTVPNGCLQTQMDAMKATMEGQPFGCHHGKKGERRPTCHGWVATRVFLRDRNLPMHTPVPWPFSPPDE